MCPTSRRHSDQENLHQKLKTAQRCVFMRLLEQRFSLSRAVNQ